MAKIGFLGAGNMAEAIIKGVIDAKIYKSKDIIITDIRIQQAETIRNKYKVIVFHSNPQLAKSVDILVLSVKPQGMPFALRQIKDSVRKNLLIVSIAAGVTTKKIQKVLGNVAVVRVMPNTPALIGQGAAAIYATKNAKAKVGAVKQIFSAVGLAVEVSDEKLLDAVTAVSGSGPAYFFLLMEEMIKTAQKLGLKKDLAERIVLQTAKGAGLLAAEAIKAGQTPDILRKIVTSPGGTTEAAMKVFLKRKFEKTVLEALRAAANRSRQLSR